MTSTRFLTSVLYSLEAKQTLYSTTYEPDSLSLILPLPTEKHTLPALPSTPSQPPNTTITITVKILKPSKKFDLQINASSTVAQLKVKIEAECEVGRGEVKIVVGGRVLGVGRLDDLGITDGTIVNVTVKKVEVQDKVKWDTDDFYADVKGVVEKYGGDEGAVKCIRQAIEKM